jgi:hypothetical protein
MTLEQRGESLQRAHLLTRAEDAADHSAKRLRSHPRTPRERPAVAERPTFALPQIPATVPPNASNARKARRGPASAPRPNSTHPVLARCPDVPSTKAAAAPPAVALPVADKGSHASAAVDAYPRQHERRSQPGIADSLAGRQKQDGGHRSAWNRRGDGVAPARSLPPQMRAPTSAAVACGAQDQLGDLPRMRDQR